MTTETRLTKLEEKIDKVSIDVVELKSDMKHLLPKMEEHITGDKKIINHITPLLEKLPKLLELVEDHQYDKRQRLERKERLVSLTQKLGALSLLVGIVVGVSKLVG